MIKNLIFDFGKVLVDYEYFETLDQIFKTHEQAEEFYHLLIDGKWNENMDRGDSFEETFCKMQQIMPQYKEEIVTVAQRFNDFVRGEKEGMRTLLTQLKAEGYHLYGLSNWCTKCHETMAQYPIFQLLEGQVISSEEKIIKPDRAIYERICQKYNLKPEECLFADDRMENRTLNLSFIICLIFKTCANISKRIYIWKLSGRLLTIYNDFSQFLLVLFSILKADGLHSEFSGCFYIFHSVVCKKAFFWQ